MTDTLDAITIYDTEVRRVKKNEYISFVEPLLTGNNIKSSVYNLNRIQTIFNIKAWVKTENIDYDGFSGTTLDESMTSSTAVTLSWDSNSVTGFVKQFVVMDQPEKGYVFESGTRKECKRCEIIFEVGSAI